MKNEARYVIRLSHAGKHLPSEQALLLAKVREAVRPLGGQAINLRVSRRALEFDLFCKRDSELHPFLTALEPIGPVLGYRRLDLPPPPVIPAQVMAEARALFNEERYWEAHEVLEGLWKIVKGPEKQLLQGLILTAAALVHAQKDEPSVVARMLEEAALRLENQTPVYYGIDVHAFLRNIKKVILTRAVHFPTI